MPYHILMSKGRAVASMAAVAGSSICDALSRLLQADIILCLSTLIAMLGFCNSVGGKMKVRTSCTSGPKVVS